MVQLFPLYFSKVLIFTVVWPFHLYAESGRMYPIPTEDRTIPQRFSKAVHYKPPLESYDGKLDERRKDHAAAQFGNNPLHVLWSHFSPNDERWLRCGRRHVTDTDRSEHESKKRSKYECAPLPESYLRNRVLPHDGGLAEPRMAVKQLASTFEKAPFLLNVGEDPRNHPPPKLIELDPSFRASSNPLICSTHDPPVRQAAGRRALELPRSATTEPPPTFSTDSGFGRYSEPEKKSGKKAVPATLAKEFDPLHIKATGGGRFPQLAPVESQSSFFRVQQDLLKEAFPGVSPKRLNFGTGKVHSNFERNRL